ncbi:flagellar hook-length control protein FliK [Tumebacillus lipolyticus]|uniref:Flagellar hook-length control protein FliK n=1 Tax=Tumebacillus lipolyticus TaxID=1280370 RepID=A0ABW5A076_9BACL
MELQVGNMGVAPTASAGAKAFAAAGKGDGAGAFNLLLQAAGAAQQAGETQKSDQEGLLAALAALANGMAAPLLLNDLPLDNADLAQVLQKFGVSSELLTALLENPQGNPLETLTANPKLMPEFNAALGKMMQTLLAQPQLATPESKTAILLQTLMQSVQIEAVLTGKAEQGGLAPLDIGWTGMTNSALGKLQATMSLHTLQSFLLGAGVKSDADKALLGAAMPEGGKLAASAMLTEEGTAGGASAKQATEGVQVKQADNLPPAAGFDLQAYLKLPERTVKLEPVVTMRADQLRSELSSMLVKRASLIESPGRHEFRIILEPQGLGEVEVRIQSINKQISVQLIADSSASRGMLDSALAGLKLQLQAQGIQYDRIEVQSSANGQSNLGSGLPEHRGSGQNAREQQGGQSRKATVDTFTLSDVSAIEDQMIIEPDSIDVTA